MGVRHVIVETIQSGSLVLAKRSDGVDTCILMQHYQGLVSSDVMYYYAWSLNHQAFVIIYSVDIIGVIDENFGLQIEMTYPNTDSDGGYAANGFRWRAVSGVNPDEVDPNGFIDIAGPFDQTNKDEE